MGNNHSVIRPRIEELTEAIGNLTKDIEDRKEALDQIEDIISKEALTQDQITRIIYNLINSFVNSEDSDFNKTLVTVMHGLLVNNTISDNDIEITKDFLLLSSIHQDPVIKKYSVRVLGDFLRKKINQLDKNSAIQIINSLYKNAKNEDDVVRNNSIWNLNIIIEARKVPINMQDQVIEFLIEKLTDVDDEVINRAMGSLAQIAISFTLDANNIERILNVFITNVQDLNDKKRSSSLLGIANLAKKNLIPDTKINKIIEILKSHSRDKYDDARCNATSSLQSLALYNRVPEDKRKMVEIIFNLCLKDDYTYVKQNGMFGLLALNKEVKEHNLEKRKHEIIIFNNRSPLEYAILVTTSAPKEVDDLAIELDRIRQKLRVYVHYSGTVSTILQREKIFESFEESNLEDIEKELKIFRKKIKNLKEEAHPDTLFIIDDPDFSYIEEIAEYMSVYFSTRKGRDIKEHKRDLIYCYQAYFIYENIEDGISKNDLDKLMTLYEYCKDPEYNTEILKLISESLTKGEKFYLSEEYENKLQEYNKNEYKKESLEQNMEMLDIVIANFRQRFVNKHMQEREHEICRDARHAIDIDKDRVPSICSNRIIAIPDILVGTKVKEVTKTSAIPISFRKLAKFRPHIISPGMITFGINEPTLKERGLLDKYNGFLRLELIKAGFLDSSLNVNLDVGNKKVNLDKLIDKTIELTKDFFKRENLSLDLLDEDVFKNSLNEMFDNVIRNRKKSTEIMQGFILKEVVSLLFVIERTVPIASIDSKLNSCLLGQEEHQKTCRMLKRLTETVIQVSDSFPSPGIVSISGNNKVEKIADKLLSNLEGGESLIIPTGTPIKPGARESSHFFYVLLKNIDNEPNKVKLVIVNAGDNIESAIDVDQRFAAEDVNSAGNYWLCRETAPIDLTNEDEKTFVKNYIYKALVLPHTPFVKEEGNVMNRRNLLENINLISPSFKGKDYKDLSYKPEVLPEDKRSYSVPSQLFGNCTIFNLQYSLKFMFDWNESKLTHFIHDSLARYNAFLYQKVDMKLAHHGKEERNNLDGGKSINSAQDDFSYRERMLIQREESRSRSNTI